MGLDMYLYRVNKIQNEENAKKRFSGKLDHEIEDAGYRAFYIEEGKYNPELSDLMPYLTKIDDVRVQCVDEEKIMREYNLPEDAYRCGWGFSDGNIDFMYAFESAGDRDIKDFHLPISEFEKKFVYEKPTTAAICQIEEVAYWRKFYDLQEALHLGYREDREKEREETGQTTPVDIENCGYHAMTESMWEALKEYDKDVYRKLHGTENDDEKIFYYEWY